jgi:hypothetical protein
MIKKISRVNPRGPEDPTRLIQVCVFERFTLDLQIPYPRYGAYNFLRTVIYSPGKLFWASSWRVWESVSWTIWTHHMAFALSIMSIIAVLLEFLPPRTGCPPALRDGSVAVWIPSILTRMPPLERAEGIPSIFLKSVSPHRTLTEVASWMGVLSYTPFVKRSAIFTLLYRNDTWHCGWVDVNLNAIKPSPLRSNCCYCCCKTPHLILQLT